MKIPVDDIPQSPKEIRFSERIEELNKLYNEGSGADFQFPPRFDVRLVYYRSGRELFFNGEFEGEVIARCGRCLDDYALHLKRQFDLVLIPAPVKVERGAGELRGDDLGLSYYSTEEIDMAPLVGEQIMLALPTRPLCADNCQGLCDRCGANLNREVCRCSAEVGDTRMAIFRTLKVGR